jgi:hypothetical protein
LNTPSLRLEESNANLTANFYIDRDIPMPSVTGSIEFDITSPCERMRSNFAAISNAPQSRWFAAFEQEC